MNQNKIKNLFLKQSYEDAWTDYEKTLTKKYFVKWDYVILTASNEEQAQAYRKQIDRRIAEGYLGNDTHYAVLSDPDGKRVGSGGATFNVIKYIRNHSGDANCFAKNRVLVIHSGGDSKRIPQYSSCGKLFSPVPRLLPDGRQSTLFDEFVVGMSGIAARIKSGMLVLSGDVLLLYNPLQIDFQFEGAAAISIKEPVQTGKDHGVFLNDGTGRVEKFLHKLTVQQLTDVGAVNEQGNVDLDTGAIIFDKNILNCLLNLISTNNEIDGEKFNDFVNEKARLSFYGDFLFPLAKKVTREQYLKEKAEGVLCEELASCRYLLWDALNGYSMQLICLSPAEFIHFGTTKELLSLLTDDISNYEFLGWEKQNLSVSGGGAFACSNSYVEDGAKIFEDSYIEDSIVDKDSTVGHKCVISNVELSGVAIPDEMCLHGIQTLDGMYIVRTYGVLDNPKAILDEGATLFGKGLSVTLKELDIDVTSIWDKEPYTLWNAKLFPECGTIKEAIEWAVWLNLLLTRKSLDNNSKTIREYLSKDRQSLYGSFNIADTNREFQWKDNLDDKIKIHLFLDMLERKVNIETAKKVFGKKGISTLQKKQLLEKAKNEEFSTKIRILYFLSKWTSGDESEELEQACFQAISESVQLQPSEINSNNRMFKKDNVEVYLPIRANFGGGWSDTPPYCNENGGSVLNAAVYLKGQAPVVVKIKKIKENKIVLSSVDFGSEKSFSDISELKNCSDPFDPFALHKAALISSGLVREDDMDLSCLLEEIGSGFSLSTNVIDIPRGSGLGTSSILSGACVKAIFDIMDASLPEQELYRTVTCMEQLMTTGGGWQDQVGGLLPGIKFLTTKPGLDQLITAEKVEISDDVMQELNDRFALIYTGQRRLARNLLRDVVGKYMVSNEESLEALHQIQRISALMRFELEKGDIDAFASLLNTHWKMSKQIDKGCTNTCIDQIFMSCDDLIDGKMICGAGGGGFLQVILKKNVSKEQLRDRLRSVYQESGVDVWDCEIK